MGRGSGRTGREGARGRRAQRTVATAVVVTLLVTAALGTAVGTAGRTAATADGGETPVADGAVDSPLAPDDAVAAPAATGAAQEENRTVDDLDALVDRTMDRVERIRGLAFTEDVPVRVITREEFRRSRVGAANASPAETVQINQQWKALFVVGQDTDATAVQRTARGEGTLAFYDPQTAQITIIADSADPDAVDEGVLAHELVHALQDQHFDVNERLAAAETTDEYRGLLGLTEGDASYVQQLYDERCGVQWSCTADPMEGTANGSGPVPGNATEAQAAALAMSVYMFQPYSDGAAYVHSLRERGGWDAVDARYDDPPTSTSRTIDPDDADEGVEPLPDDARDRWTPVGVGDTLGEAAVFTMVWFQSAAHGAGVVDPRQFGRAEAGEFDTYNYTSEPSAGWANDRFVPYERNGEYGYVWTLQWESEADAREFRDAYRAVLDEHGAERRDERTWVIPGGGFEGAYLVERDGRTVTVANAPTVADIGELRASGENATAAPPAASVRDGVARSPAASAPGGVAQSPAAATPPTFASGTVPSSFQPRAS